mgnify:CR=1 FL=1
MPDIPADESARDETTSHPGLSAELAAVAERHGVLVLTVVTISPEGAEIETGCNVPALDVWATALNDAIVEAVEAVGEPPRMFGRA